MFGNKLKRWRDGQTPAKEEKREESELSVYCTRAPLKASSLCVCTHGNRTNMH